MTKSAIESERQLAPLDRAMTLDRDETKYVVNHTRIGALLRVLSTELSAHRYTGPAANRLPDAQHFSSTIYFDTASRALYRAARDNPEHNAKLRAREYYDLHSSLAELATDPDQIVRYQPWLFLELKRREGARTSKHRVRLDKSKVASFFEQRAAEAKNPSADASGGEDTAALAEFCASLGEPLAPSCIVNYRRLAFEDPAGLLRVTVDLDVGFYAAPADLWQRRQALVRAYLGSPCGSAPACLIEVKQRAELPSWLVRTLQDIGARPEAFSKFNAASEAVHGRK